MRPTHQLVHSRARIGQRYALFPLEGYPSSVVPTWHSTAAKILCSPAIGADFAMYEMTVAAGGGTSRRGDGRVETFLYVLDGDDVSLTIGGGSRRDLRPGGFALVPPEADFSLATPETSARLLVLRKAYEPLRPDPWEAVIGHAADVPADVWMDIPQARLQRLVNDDDWTYDLAMNIFTFEPGFGLPYVETHVMEHGALILQGKGLYYLDGDWMEVEAGDFIWMGPYCPQSFYATGPTPAKYIYYKNVNREIAL